MTTPYLGHDLILVLSPPRSGSTMLQRMLGSHSAVQTHPEPHVLTPLAFQGYYRQIGRADYNHGVAAQALREFVEFLPGGEGDYLDACRAYCAVLYGRARAAHGKAYFLDKTPNYADTILPFIARLLPEARVIVLTRHPVAQLASMADTFYGGDFHKTQALRDCMSTFIPPMAAFMRSQAMPFVHVRYEDLVREPERELRRLLAFLGLPFEPACLDFGGQAHITKTFGDPKIGRHRRPVADSADLWVDALLGRPDRERLCRTALSRIRDDDLAVFGYPAATLFEPLEAARAAGRTARDAPPRWPRSWRWRARLAWQALVRRPAIRRWARAVQRSVDAWIGPDQP